jgi:hypothetical protein
MKKLFAALAACLVASMLSACANSPIQLQPVKIPVIPPSQLAQDICPIVKADLAILTSTAGLALLTPAQQADVTNKVMPSSNAVCAAAATVDLTDLQNFNATAFPALIDIVSAIPAIPNQPAVLLALQLAQPIVQQVVNDAVAASKVSTTVPASSTAASAPAPAPAASAQ